MSNKNENNLFRIKKFGLFCISVFGNEKYFQKVFIKNRKNILNFVF